MVPGCDESLPPRDDPQGILQATLSVDEGVVVVTSDGRITHAGVITLTVRNKFNEVLQAESSLGGEIEVWMAEDPSVRAVVPIGKADLADQGIAAFDQTTLRPDSPAVFSKQWSHTTTNGTPLWTFVGLEPVVTLGGERFCQSGPVSLVARGSMKLFKNVAALNTNQVRFTLIYQVFGITCD